MLQAWKWTKESRVLFFPLSQLYEIRLLQNSVYILYILLQQRFLWLFPDHISLLGKWGLGSKRWGWKWWCPWDTDHKARARKRLTWGRRAREQLPLWVSSLRTGGNKEGAAIPNRSDVSESRAGILAEVQTTEYSQLQFLNGFTFNLYARVQLPWEWWS